MKPAAAGRSQAGVPPSAHLAQPLQLPAALQILRKVTPCRRQPGLLGLVSGHPGPLYDSVPCLECPFHTSSPCLLPHALQAQPQGPICILETPQGSPSSTHLVALLSCQNIAQ